LSDGKSRVALAIIDVFLRMNELALAAEEPVAVKTIRLLAAGELIDEQLSEWIEANSAEQGWRSLARRCTRSAGEGGSGLVIH
jgi:prophage maintenance system killer protein